MSPTALCQHCGAPWRPDLTGACRYCKVVAPPDGAPAGLAGGRQTVDADALARFLMAVSSDSEHPLDRLATTLAGVAEGRVTTSSGSGRVTRVALALDDWQYESWLDHGDTETQATHMVRGVVLKRQPLAFDEWIAVVAAHLAEYASTHHHVYQAIAGLAG
jgi:hypothetical protein